MKNANRMAILLIAFHAAVLLWAAWAPRFTISDHDEPIYFGAGSVIWKTGNVANVMTVPHPPFTYYLNSLLLGPDPVDWSRTTDWFREATRRNDKFQLHFLQSIGWDLLWQAEASGKSVSWVLFRGRLPFLLISIGFAVLLFVFLRRFSEEGALTATALYALSPLVLFLAPGIMTDLTMTLLATLCAIALAFWSGSLRVRTALLAGFLAGLAFGTKVSALALLPLFPLAALRGVFFSARPPRATLRPALVGLGLALLVSFVTLWGLYGFQVDSIRNAEELHHSFSEHEWRSDPPPETRLKRTFPRLYETPLPAVSYFMPLRGVILRRGDLLERTPVEGPLAPLIESRLYPWTVMVTYFPIACFPLLFLAIIVVFRRRRFAFLKSRWVVVAAWPFVYAASTFSSNYFYGSRHVLPVFVPVILLTALAVGTTASDRIRRIAMLLTLATVAAEAVLFLMTGKPWALWMYGAVS
jgi:4-amino-4-deoxy-L-arabinose transferase-like glycosyltransferase